MLSGLMGLYFATLVSFAFVSHPVVYCAFLVLSALSAGGVVYSLMGFSWYVALFCLVYIGGVYVLFIFVSVHNPNSFPGLGGTFLFFFLSWLLFSTLFYLTGGCLPGFVEGSHYLCSSYEGFSYCLFCLILMGGFVCVSVVVGDKGSFFR
uniref:NADH dehydrogenase subunit 6 n=1 Tax=Carassotrema koreanum TaxID=2573094 RepID=UPI002176C5D1|nr:NADH dehydrogenase subunit 6 [Carassotrema koreanum]UUF92006.1 NADH dehydrogenase subunit 6 [Carassotrema koreanum]